MEKIQINPQTCIKCGHCAEVCPSAILRQDESNKSIFIEDIDTCITCGQCVAICPTNALIHQDFPAETLHQVDRNELPAPDAVELLIKYRRSTRAFSTKPIQREQLMRILEAAHRAPTASNMQKVAFTLVTSPEKIKEITEFTLDTFASALQKLQNPLLKPLLKRIMPDAYRYVPAFKKLLKGYEQGYDGILRGATALIFIHAPKKSRFGPMDTNLAYQNASLMAESLGIGQFYTGFVLAADAQSSADRLSQILGIEGKVFAGMALGVPKYRFPKSSD